VDNAPTGLAVCGAVFEDDVGGCPVTEISLFSQNLLFNCLIFFMKILEDLKTDFKISLI
jgi:hypothetical protein